MENEIMVTPVQPLWVVKVGGSLFDLPDLGPRLTLWLTKTIPSAHRVLLVPGGGPTTDVIRNLDRIHRLGEEPSHWLALRALTLNAHFLIQLLPDSRMLAHPRDEFLLGRVHLLDAYAYCQRELEQPLGPILEERWATGSDVLAVHVAMVGSADRLILLKSTSIDTTKDWLEAGNRFQVDASFPTWLKETSAQLHVFSVNLRADVRD
jgi:5-(aminomethyl)-3-furanmethanol phosphate kinase